MYGMIDGKFNDGSKLKNLCSAEIGLMVNIGD